MQPDGHSRTEADPPSPRPVPDTEHHRFIAAFTELFKAARAGARPHWNGKTGALVRDLLASHGHDECLARARRMFEMAPTWPAGSPDIGTLSAHFDKFAPAINRRPPTGGYVLGPERDEAFYANAAKEVF